MYSVLGQVQARRFHLDMEMLRYIQVRKIITFLSIMNERLNLQASFRSQHPDGLLASDAALQAN